MADLTGLQTVLTNCTQVNCIILLVSRNIYLNEEPFSKKKKKKDLVF